MTATRGLKDIGEFGLISRISGQAPEGPGILIGIGDDAAAVYSNQRRVNLITTDMLVEGVHFDLSFSDPFSLGKKSLSVNLSDLAAMGGEPRHFLLSLAIPPATTVDTLDELTRGMLLKAAEYCVNLIGGDTCSSPDRLVISITLMGDQLPERIVRRNGARKGDLVCVTGAVGDSALGLEQLKKGIRAGYAVERHLDPTPRVREGVSLAEAGLATAMIDISDGLPSDLGHILDMSALGARIRFYDLPLSRFFREHTAGASPDSVLRLVAGGEDYELLFTIPPGKFHDVRGLMERLGTSVTEIGEITAEPGLVIIDTAGELIAPPLSGYDHFA